MACWPPYVYIEILSIIDNANGALCRKSVYVRKDLSLSNIFMLNIYYLRKLNKSVKMFITFIHIHFCNTSI